MPIYEFKCKSCEHLFDELVPMHTDGDLLTCPSCGQVGARRLVSAFAAHGLENGHIAVGRKFTGGSSSAPAAEGAPASAETAAAPVAPAAPAPAAAPAASSTSKSA